MINARESINLPWLAGGVKFGRDSILLKKHEALLPGLGDKYACHEYGGGNLQFGLTLHNKTRKAIYVRNAFAFKHHNKSVKILGSCSKHMYM